MSKKYNLLFFCFGFIFLGCKQKETPDFFFTSKKLKYKFHDVAVSEIQPELGDFLILNLAVTYLDSTYYKSSNHTSTLDFFWLDSSKEKSILKEGFLQLFEGDSVSFFTDGKCFCTEYLLQDSLCIFYDLDEICISFRLENIVREKNKLMPMFLGKANNLVDNILNEWMLTFDSVHNYGLINWVYFEEGTGSPVQLKDEIAVFYSCKLPNNELVYRTDSLSIDRFVVGVEGQLIEGFDYLVQQLNYGDHVLGLIPPSLAFKSEGGVEGKVPPNSPLIFEVKVLENEFQ